MSKLLLTSDLHLGHKSICRYRPQFTTMEEHNEVIYDNLASNVSKRDTLILLGDIAFTLEWHERIAAIKCKHKVLILGNHDTDRKPRVHQFAHLYNRVHGLLSHRNHWLSHCPIHPQEIRNRLGNIHGHLHGNNVWADGVEPELAELESKHGVMSEVDQRYINVCVEHTDWKPITWEDAVT